MTTGEQLPFAVRLASWVSELEFADLPDDVVAMAKLMVLDQVGVQLRGATLPNVTPVRELILSMHAKPEATIALSDVRTTAAYAAYANGTYAHSAQYDDSHALAWHIGACVVTTALAFGERDRRSGADVVTAIVAGAQVMSLLGASMTPAMQKVGWHGAKVLGVFAAAATAGKLLGLSSAQLAQALAIAASDASGTMEYDRSGGEVKRLHSGAAARSGAQAALLAQQGLTGPLTAIEGPRGLLQLFGGSVDTTAIEAGWDHFQILDTIFRMYPVVGTIASPLDAIRELQAAHGFEWKQLEHIRVGLAAYAVSHGGTINRPTDVLSAQYSLAYSVGLLLTRGGCRPQDYFDDHLWTDADVLAAGDLVKVYVTEFDDQTPMLSSQVDVRLLNGREFSVLRKGFRGHPASPANRADLQDKFSENVADLVRSDVAAEIMQTIERLHSIGDIRELTSLLGAQM